MQASSGTSKPVHFLFPGHGAEHVGMTEGLYCDFPVYREHLSEGFRVASDVLGTDFKRVLFPASSDRQPAELELRKTAVIQPSLFLVQYAAGRTLIDLGVKPSGMLGHSVGEYAAACLAGVFSFETALRIVAKRGELVQSVPEGRMLAAAVTSREAIDYLGPEVDIGSINGPRQCVFSGTPEGIEELSAKFKRDGVASRLLSSNRAFHSMLLDPILDEFRTFLEGLKFEEPVSPFVSCLHGKWANPSEVCQAEYWVNQLREPVKFLEGLGALERENAVFLEVGPGGGLGSLVKSIVRQDCLSCGMDDGESPGGLKAFEAALKKLKERGAPVTSELMDGGPRELKTQELPEPRRDRTRIETSIEAEQIVASCFSRVLGLSEVGYDASFLELGGNSLMAMQVITRLRDTYQCELGIREFFNDPTVRGVGRTVARSLARDCVEQEKPVCDGRAAEQGLTVCPGTTPRKGNGSLDFGVFFFAGDENEVPDDRYGLVLDAARLADRAGITSIWLPERHFNKFGGLYPNPAVLGAAIASVTSQIQIRGGSVVAPLHHPVRISEEWSVVDNLSKGRIGVAFGSGFHPNDFLLAPDSFADRKEKMFASLESIRKLWKGEGFQGISGAGEEISVRLFPTPYSKELPVWLATSRSATTFAEAGEMGANVLTALLRLSVDELAERIRVYRQAWRDAGHVEGKGKVTVMLHTYLGESDEGARSTAEDPLRTYLRSHMEHTRVVSEEKAESGDDVSLSGGDEEALLDYALDRYLKGNSLVGTAESCLGMIRQLEDAGVDEIACLVDFGIGREDLMGSLERLGQLQQRTRLPNDTTVSTHSFGKTTEEEAGSCDVFPMSFAQRRIWMIDQVEEGLTAYNIPFVWSVKGKLNVEALRKALEFVVERHSMLRSTFKMIDGEPVQQILPKSSFVLPVVDCDAPTEAEWESLIQEHSSQEAGLTFDLERGPVIRGLLLRFAGEDQVLLLTVHHIVFDALSSFEIFRSELGVAYAAFENGESPDLPALSLQYSDYVNRQRDSMQGRRLEALYNYWLKHLENLPVLELPSDRARPFRMSYSGGQCRFSLSADLACSLKGIGEAEVVTCHMLLLSAFLVLISRYSNQKDIVIGMPISGREGEDFEKLIGFFINTLVIRQDLAGDPSFKEVLGRVRSTSLDAYEHQDLPFDLLVEKLNPERTLERTPVIQMMFYVRHQASRDLLLGGLEVSRLPEAGKSVRMELEMQLWPEGEGFDGVVTYSTDLYDEATIQRMIGHYQQLLKGVTINPSEKISRLPLLGENEKAELLTKWSGTGESRSKEEAIQDVFIEQVTATPDKIAVVYREQSLTYLELDQRSNELARHLARVGVRDGDLVAVCIDRSLESVIAFLAVLKIGAAYLPLAPSDPDPHLEFLLDDSQAKVLVAGGKVGEMFGTREILVVSLDLGEGRLFGESSDRLDRDCHGGHAAYVNYTSGSTGKPKGVLVTHRGVIRLVRDANYVDLGPEETMLHRAPLSFDMATFEIWGALLNGGCLAILPVEETSLFDLGELIRKKEVSVSMLPTGLFHLMAMEGLEFLRPLKQLLVGGDVLSPELANRVHRALPECRLFNVYGPTENAVLTSCFEIREVVAERKSVPIGRPISGCRVYVLDESMELVPVGVVGELFAAGDGVAIGYLNRPELTAERFVNDPFSKAPNAMMYRTGDRVRWLPDGNLEFVERSDFQVKIRGYRVECGEVEGVLNRVFGVRDSVVVPRENSRGEKSLVAYFVPENGGSPDSSSIRSALALSLPDYMIPEFFVSLDALPLGPTGKVDRGALPDPEVAIDRNESGGDVPLSLMEFELAKIWARILDRESVGRHDNFFELGGHSLLATRMVAEVDRLLACRFPIAVLFQAPTIELLARRLIDEQWAPAWSSLVPLKVSGSRPPLFLVHGWGGTVFSFLGLVEQIPDEQPCYGIQAVGLDGKEERHTSVEQMAAHYVDEICSFQPEGPVSIAGYSMGGLIAFELAQQLTRRGREVAFLGIIDSGFISGVPWQAYLVRVGSYLPCRMGYHFKRWIRTPFREKGRYLSGRWIAFSHWLRSYRSRDPVVQTAERGAIAPEIPGYEDYYHAVAASYRPLHYSGRASVFLSETSPAGLHSGWRYRVKGGVEFHRIPGNHEQLHSDPVCLRQLATLIAEALQKSRAANVNAPGHGGFLPGTGKDH